MPNYGDIDSISATKVRPIRGFAKAVIGLALRIFFRRIELHGLEKMPPKGPVIFVLNHINALIDPGILLVTSPRPVSFLAKSTLYTMPFVGGLVRGFDSIPIFRKMDSDGKRVDNSQTFVLARKLLENGGILAIFPEGTSHSDPKLRPMKTGAARIALGAQLDDLMIVPIGLDYESKATFRSTVLLYFGEPFSPGSCTFTDAGEPGRPEVLDLTERIGAALGDVVVQAEHAEALALVDRAERIFTSQRVEADGSEASLAERFELRRRFVAAYHRLKLEFPDRLHDLEQAIVDYEHSAGELGLDPGAPLPAEVSLAKGLAAGLRSLLVLVVLLPVAVAGVVLNYAIYRFVGAMAERGAKGDDDMISSIKVIGSVVVFPVSWLILTTLIYLYTHVAEVWLGLLFLPLSGYLALLFYERFGRLFGAARGPMILLTRRQVIGQMREQRRQIHDTIVALGDLVEDPA